MSLFICFAVSHHAAPLVRVLRLKFTHTHTHTCPPCPSFRTAHGATTRFWFGLEAEERILGGERSFYRERPSPDSSPPEDCILSPHTSRRPPAFLWVYMSVSHREIALSWWFNSLHDWMFPCKILIKIQAKNEKSREIPGSPGNYFLGIP